MVSWASGREEEDIVQEVQNFHQLEDIDVNSRMVVSRGQGRKADRSGKDMFTCGHKTAVTQERFSGKHPRADRLQVKKSLHISEKARTKAFVFVFAKKK